MGLDFDNIDLYDVTLGLYGVSSFGDECNRSSDTSRLYPFMAMSASNKFTLCNVYDILPHQEKSWLEGGAE